MSKHTPGPWVVGNTDKLSFGRKQGNGTEPLGFVYGPSLAENSEHGRECLANARLVAAAPDLLNELREVLEWAKKEKAPLRQQEMESIARLIAKATGEQQ